MRSSLSSLGLRVASPPQVRRIARPLKFRKTTVLGTSQISLRQKKPDRRCIANASDHDDEQPLEKSEYIEAVIESVAKKKECGVVDFRLKDGKGSVLPMFIGDFETTSIVNHISNKESPRPMTYDFMKNTLLVLGYKVSQIHVTALVGFTYHARVYYRSVRGDEVSVDSRPSDAVNLALRFNAPIFIHRDVADKMATSRKSAMERSELDVVRSCREEIALQSDPTVMLKLQMEMAIAEERYSAAAKLRDEIDRLLSSDRILGLVVALESALSGDRYEEAVQIRDELRNLRLNNETQSSY